jgi:hypothetical protein
LKSPDALGFHGIVVRSADPRAAARVWRRLTGLPVLRRGPNRIVLGRGPELFVEIRRTRRGTPEGVEEVHLAVREIGALKTGPLVADGLGGDCLSRKLRHVRVVVRQFRRAPSAPWR